MLQWVYTIHLRTLVSHWLVSFILKNHLSTTIQLIDSFVYCFIFERKKTNESKQIKRSKKEHKQKQKNKSKKKGKKIRKKQTKGK